jgi:hypothetical protein
MSVHVLDVVVLTEDIPAQGLRQDDWGTVVDIYALEALEVEFVTAVERIRS